MTLLLAADDGKYHLYVSAMAHGRGLSSWGSNSQIHHAVASDPMEVFVKVDTVLPSEAHNASPLRHPNGRLFLQTSHMLAARTLHTNTAHGHCLLHTNTAYEHCTRALHTNTACCALLAALHIARQVSGSVACCTS